MDPIVEQLFSPLVQLLTTVAIHTHHQKDEEYLERRSKQRGGKHTNAGVSIAVEVRIARAVIGPRAKVGAGGSNGGTVVDPIGAIVDGCIRLGPGNEMIQSPQDGNVEKENESYDCK